MMAMLCCDSVVGKTAGKRSAGKPHAAFDEGGQGVTLASTLLGQTHDTSTVVRRVHSVR